MAGIDWRLQGIEINACNCDWGCPCQFNALPSQGHCRASLGFRIDKGHFGDTSLDGVLFVFMAAWPAAIHQGGGEAQLIVDERTSDEQRQAVEAIYRGHETEPMATIFNVFSNVIDSYHETLVRAISFAADVEARTGRFAVDGMLETVIEPITNPVTGRPHRAQVTLPHGFEYHTTEFASATMKSRDTVIALETDKSFAHLQHLHWTRAGPVH